MTTLQLEALTLRLVDQVRAGQPVEDAQVELKRVLPQDAYKAARRIAGHANASRGQPVVWIIGLDEDEGVTGADKAELSDWWPQVQRYFDDLPPELLLQPMNVPIEGDDGERLTVVALAFDTSRLPFVVKAKGQAGPVQREVPYRDATGLRSAKRGDIIRLAYPITPRLDVELLGVRVFLSEGSGRSPSDPKGLSWHAHWTLYFIAPGNSEVVYPSHQCSAEINTDSGLMISLSPMFETDRDGRNVIMSGDDLIISGSGRAKIRAKANAPVGSSGAGGRLRLLLRLQAVTESNPMVLRSELTEGARRGLPKPTASRAWDLAE